MYQNITLSIIFFFHCSVSLPLFAQEFSELKNLGKTSVPTEQPLHLLAFLSGDWIGSMSDSDGHCIFKFRYKLYRTLMQNTFRCFQGGVLIRQGVALYQYETPKKRIIVDVHENGQIVSWMLEFGKDHEITYHQMKPTEPRQRMVFKADDEKLVISYQQKDSDDGYQTKKQIFLKRPTEDDDASTNSSSQEATNHAPKR